MNMRTLLLNLFSLCVLFGTSCNQPCDDVVCYNNGICIDGTCECPDGFEGNDCSIVANCGGATSVTFNGHAYGLVTIGSQCWFAENLRTEYYANGDAIPGNLSNSEWTSTSSGAQAIYNNNDAKLATYGRLYNWYAVDDSRGLCPSGWHVPTDDEWTLLTDELGGSSVAGAAMKSSPSDSPSWDGVNSSGFSALPGGTRITGDFGNEGLVGYWWSASNAWYRYLNLDADNVFRLFMTEGAGFSVRCVRDE